MGEIFEKKIIDRIVISHGFDGYHYRILYSDYYGKCFDFSTNDSVAAYDMLKSSLFQDEHGQELEKLRIWRHAMVRLIGQSAKGSVFQLEFDLVEPPKLVQINTPPISADKLLAYIIPRDRSEFILGDLEEKFRTVVVPKYGIRYARFWYWGQVVVEGLAGIRAHLLNIAGLATLTKIVDWMLKRRS